MAARSLGDTPQFIVASISGPCVTLTEAPGLGPARALFFVLEEAIVRLLVLPSGVVRGPPSYAIAPGLADVPDETGRQRLDITGFTCPPFSHRTTDGGRSLLIETSMIRVSVKLDGLACTWDQRAIGGAAWARMFADRPTQAYDWGWWADDGRISHYAVQLPGERYLGVGEVSGELDRAGRRIRLANTDAMGYCARTSDPLYKHIPFFIGTRRRAALSPTFVRVVEAAPTRNNSLPLCSLGSRGPRWPPRPRVRRLLRHARGRRARLWRRAVELPRALPIVQRAWGRPRRVGPRRAAHRRRDGALHVAHRPPGTAARVELGLLGLVHGLHGRGRRMRPPARLPG